MKKMEIDGDIALTKNEVFYKDFWNGKFFKIGEYEFDGKCYDDEHFASLTDVDQYRYLCNRLTAGADPL